MCPSDLAGIIVQDPVLPNDGSPPPPPPPPKASSAIFEDEEKSKVCKDKEKVFFMFSQNGKTWHQPSLKNEPPVKIIEGLMFYNALFHFLFLSQLCPVVFL